MFPRLTAAKSAVDNAWLRFSAVEGARARRYCEGSAGAANACAQRLLTGDIRAVPLMKRKRTCFTISHDRRFYPERTSIDQ